uniref:Uncharacterized protein n=1 Tax=Globodera rostochiensis TaxID=31243 RepID=A0A914HW59_GLORO
MLCDVRNWAERIAESKSYWLHFETKRMFRWSTSLFFSVPKDFNRSDFWQKNKLFWLRKRAERRLTNFFDRRPNRSRNCSASVAHPMPSNLQRQQIRKNEIPSVRPCPSFLPYSPPPAYDEACSTAISIADEPPKHNKKNIVECRHQSNKNVRFLPSFSRPPSYIK